MMARYKGRLSAKATENKYTNIVELKAAVFSYRERGLEIEAWYRERGIQSHGGQGFYLEPDFYVHACFEFSADAEAFAIQFGGQLLGPGHPSKRPLRKGQQSSPTRRS